MKSVNIAELKNRLSVYLNEVKAGEEILVCDRNRPVARIIPLARSRDEDEELLSLASEGKLRFGQAVSKSRSGKCRRHGFLLLPCDTPSNASAMKTKGLGLRSPVGLNLPVPKEHSRSKGFSVLVLCA